MQEFGLANVLASFFLARPFRISRTIGYKPSASRSLVFQQRAITEEHDKTARFLLIYIRDFVPPRVCVASYLSEGVHVGKHSNRREEQTLLKQRQLQSQRILPTN